MGDIKEHFQKLMMESFPTKPTDFCDLDDGMGSSFDVELVMLKHEQLGPVNDSDYDPSSDEELDAELAKLHPVAPAPTRSEYYVETLDDVPFDESDSALRADLAQ